MGGASCVLLLLSHLPILDFYLNSGYERSKTPLHASRTPKICRTQLTELKPAPQLPPIARHIAAYSRPSQKYQFKARCIDRRLYRMAPTVNAVVLTLTRIIKSVVTGQAPVTLELRCIRLTTRAWKNRLYRLLPKKDYHVYIARSIYHYAYARQTQVFWKKRNKEQKRRQSNEKINKKKR